MTETPPITAEEPAAARRLTRSSQGRWFGGVCSGLGAYFDISPTIYRLVFVALALAGGAGVLLYLAAWLVIPDEGKEASLAEQSLRDHRDRPGLAVGVALLGLVALVGLSHAAFWPHPGNVWLAALVLGGGLVWWELRGRDRVVAPATPVGDAPGAPVAAPPPPRRASLFGPVVGVLVAFAGLLGLLAAAGVDLPDLRVLLGGSILFVGVAIVVGAATRRAISGLIGLAILLILALIPAMVIHVPLRGGVGDRVYDHVTLATTGTTTLQDAVGNMTVDVRDAELGPGTTELKATLGIGSLHIRVPHDVDVVVDGDVHAGDLRVLGVETNGFDAHRVVRYDAPGTAKTLRIDAEVGLGELRVERR